MSSSSPAAAPPSVVDTMLASALSGMLARVPLHPIDTCKAKLQVQQIKTTTLAAAIASQAAHANVPLSASTASAAAITSGSVVAPRSFAQFFSHTLRAEGVRGLYSGFGITFAGSAPAACLYFTSYEASKAYLGSLSFFANAAPFFSHFASGLMAEAASCVLWVPIDVVKERLQVQQQLKEMMAASASQKATAGVSTAATAAVHAGPAPPAVLYRGNLDAIMTIARMEGLRGVYRGYGATVASFGPFSAIYLSGYEQFKPVFGRIFKAPDASAAAAAAASGKFTTAAASSSSSASADFLCSLFSGASAGGLASVLTNPLDLVKLRLQVQRGTSGFTFGYRNIGHGLVSLVREEGPKALFKGAAARCMFHIPSTALTIAMFDTLRNYLTKIRTRE